MRLFKKKSSLRVTRKRSRLASFLYACKFIVGMTYAIPAYYIDKLICQIKKTRKEDGDERKYA